MSGTPGFRAVHWLCLYTGHPIESIVSNRNRSPITTQTASMHKNNSSCSSISITAANRNLREKERIPWLVQVALSQSTGREIRPPKLCLSFNGSAVQNIAFFQIQTTAVWPAGFVACEKGLSRFFQNYNQLLDPQFTSEYEGVVNVIPSENLFL